MSRNCTAVNFFNFSKFWMADGRQLETRRIVISYGDAERVCLAHRPYAILNFRNYILMPGALEKSIAHYCAKLHGDWL